MDKLTYKMTLPLDDVDPYNRESVKEEIGQYIVEAILSEVGKAKSPVKGEKWKSSLSPRYKHLKEKYSSKLIANMELHGDLLDALEFKTTYDGIEVGIFDSDQVPKADGHNNFSGKSLLPQRRFIPDEDQKFKADILKEVASIIASNSES